MIVSGRDQVNGIGNLDFDWNLFQTLSSKSSLIVTTKGIDSSFSSENDRMKSSTGYFIDLLPKKWVRYDTSLILWFSFLIFNVEVFDIGETDGPFRFTLASRMVVLV